MDFRSLDLPGIGTKYQLETSAGDTVAIIYMKDGTIQLYTLPKGHSESSAIELSLNESRRLGSVLSGAIIESEKEGVQIAFSALSDLRISVHTYLIGKELAGKCIADLQVRKRSGATIIAVSRGETNVINPPPWFEFNEGDSVVVIGESIQLKQFEKEILGV
ncbi:MAG: TrkA C-terminal domain-containing protein [Methanomicrobiaceae archaeon]|nr:TrkA C-terminal domain-containing protein [Methanomicrobiaceae archaeon]